MLDAVRKVENGFEAFDIKMSEGKKNIRTATRFDYMLLSRLKMDCDYFLGFGNRDESKLWAGSIEGQLQKMEELWEKCKPIWLKRKKLNQYKRKMLIGESK